MRRPSTCSSQQYVQNTNGDVWGRIDKAHNPLVAGASSRVRALRGVVRDTELDIEGQVGAVGSYTKVLLVKSDTKMDNPMKKSTYQSGPSLG
jgi:hypothetical protein